MAWGYEVADWVGVTSILDFVDEAPVSPLISITVRLIFFVVSWDAYAAVTVRPLGNLPASRLMTGISSTGWTDWALMASFVLVGLSVMEQEASV